MKQGVSDVIIEEDESEEDTMNTVKKEETTPTFGQMEAKEDSDDDDSSDIEEAFMETYEVLQKKRGNTLADKVEEAKEPLERETLPALKDLGMKISILTVLKDNAGKDLSKISLPVLFNDPTSQLQRCAWQCEYISLLKRASLDEDAVKRMSLVAAFIISCNTFYQKAIMKPFNPLLGETYEYEN